MTDNKNKIALFIDADNLSHKLIDNAIEQLKLIGDVIIKKAYGNWASNELKAWIPILQRHAIQPHQQFDMVKGKNATDMALTIDVVDVLHTKKMVNTIAILSSDCDFTPLATRIRAEGKTAIGLGESKTHECFIQSCNQFYKLNSTDSEQKTLTNKETTLVNNLIETTLTSPELKWFKHWHALSTVGKIFYEKSGIKACNLEELTQSKTLAEFVRTHKEFELREFTVPGQNQTVIAIKVNANFIP